jgi:hypothetical protein
VSQFWAILKRIASGLALIATLGVAVLPNGQLPKVAGPCGRALCFCPPELPANGNPWSSCQKCKPSAARSVLTLGSSVISGVELPGAAFQFVFDAGLPPAVGFRFVASLESNALIPAASVIVPGSLSTEILTPPPRAAA